jgi:heptosyltransferase-2
VTDPGAVLVCRLSALGDVVLALPVIRALRERFPQARLELLSREPFGRVLQGEPALDALHLWPGKGAPRPESVAARRWDVVVDLSGSGRSRRLLAGVPAGRVLRVQKQTLRRFAFVRLRRFGATGEGLRPAVDRMLATLAPLGIRDAELRPRFDRAAPPADGPVLIAPGAGRATKCWPIERFAEIGARLVDAGERVLAVGSADEGPLVRRVVEGLPAGRWESVTGPDPSGLPGLAGRCPVALTNDSGLLHVAEAAGARVVALFGPTHPRLGFAPLNPESVALHTGIGCSPCDLHGPETCPLGHHRCLRDLGVDEVWEALRARLPARTT